MSRTPGVLAVILTLSLAAANGFAAPLELRLRLTPGQTYRQSVTIDQVVEQQINGQAHKMAQTLGMTLGYRVQSAAASGDMQVCVTYERVRLKMTGAGGAVDYDSSKPGGGALHPAAATLGAMVGTSLEATMSPTGKISDVRGIDAIVRKMLEGLALPEGSQRAMLQQAMDRQMSQDNVRSSLGATMATFPQQPVNPGDTWEQEASVNVGPVLKVRHTWTLKERRGGRAVLGLSSRVLPGEGRAMQVGATKMTHDIAGGQTGTVTVDEATGLVVGGELEQAFEGQLIVEAPGVSGMKMPMKITGKIQITGEPGPQGSRQ